MFAIAIDGPAGAGKSSAAKAAAQELGFTYVDTGAMYRALTLYMLENHVDLTDPAAVIRQLHQVKVGLDYGRDGQRTFLNGQDVTEAIRTPEVSMATSRWVSHIPEVRLFLLDLQRDMARRANVVMDGRDIGSTILPDARLKVFLTASPEERARRRTLQLEEAGAPADYEQVLREVIQRDRQDAKELDAAAPDAVTLDTTGLSFPEVVARLTAMARERMQ